MINTHLISCLRYFSVTSDLADQTEQLLPRLVIVLLPFLSTTNTNVQYQLSDVNIQCTDIDIQVTDIDIQFTDINIQFTDIKIQYTDINIQFTDLNI